MRPRPTARALGDKSPLPLLPTVLIAAASALFLTVALVWAAGNGLSPGRLLRDPAQTQGMWPFTGFVSHLGVLILWSGAAISLFAAAVAAERGLALLLLLFGLFTFLIALDDLFMLHEYFWPRRGVPTEMSQVILGLVGTALLVGFRRRLVGARHLALYLAIGLLGTSLAVDLVVPFSTASTVVEDTTKFTGYALWAGYWVGTARVALRA